MTVAVWHTGRDLELWLGTVDWLTEPFEASLHGSGYIPDVDDLEAGDLSAELSGTGYTRLTLTGKTVDVTGTLTATLGADDLVWAGLNAGAARTVVLRRVSDEAVFAHGAILDAVSGATDLDAAGGGARIPLTLSVAPPPPPPGTWGATTAAESLAVGMSSPTAVKIAAWETFVGPIRSYHTFAHAGLTASWSVQESVLRGVLSQTTGFMAGSNATHLVTCPPLIRAPSGQTQASIGQTTQAAAGGANDAHYTEVGAIIHNLGLDTRFADGRPKVAVQPGQEYNLTSYPWYCGTDPAATKAMLDRFALKMAEGGCDMANVEFVYNVNTRGHTSRTNVLAAMPDATTVFTVDWYDIQAGTEYSAHPGNEASYVDAVFALRAGNPNPDLDTIVSANWMVQVAEDRDLYFGFDEWGLCRTQPPANVNQTGGGDQPRYIELTHAWLEAAAATGRLAWAHYFNYDVSATGLLHKIDGSNFPLAKAKFVELFG